MLLTGLHNFFVQLWLICLDAAPWLLLGLLVAGAIKVWLPSRRLARLLGGHGFWPIVKAAVIGTPLPLCSCSVIPAAVELRRSGASKGSTVSFLVSTPENGADSIALTYALLGPFMTIARPVAAIASALVAGGLTMLAERRAATDLSARSFADEPVVQAPDVPACSLSSCCGNDESGEQQGKLETRGIWQTVGSAAVYASDDLFGDIAGWLALGLVLAALMNTLVPPDAMTAWGSGLLAMLAVMLVGVPMYICATASTPVAAAMLLAGVSPGTVLVFLLAGPATNLATIGIVRRELGWSSTAAYLIGVCGTALAAGLLTDAMLAATGVSIASSINDSHQQLLPHWLTLASLVVLAMLTVRFACKTLYKRIKRTTLNPGASAWGACCDSC